MLLPYTFDGEMVGAYRIQQLLGRGRLSTLYLAMHPRKQQTVALTMFVIASRLTGHAKARFLSRFTEEVSVLTMLEHPYILSVDDFGEQEGYPYMVVPTVVRANSLLSLLQRQTRWTPLTARPLLQQICAALDHAHERGIMHSGLSPASVLINEDDETVQLTGFGLVRLLARRGIDEDQSSWAHLLSIAGTFLGSLEYMAPEYIQGLPVDARSDIYALGCILFALLSGAPPLVGTPLEMLAQQIKTPIPSLHERCPWLVPELRDQLDRILQKTLAPDPEQRFRRAGELLTQYDRIVNPYAATGDTIEPRTLEEHTAIVESESLSDDNHESFEQEN